MSKKKDKNLDLDKELKEEELDNVSGGVGASDYNLQGKTIIGGDAGCYHGPQKIGGDAGCYHGPQKIGGDAGCYHGPNK